MKLLHIERDTLRTIRHLADYPLLATRASADFSLDPALMYVDMRGPFLTIEEYSNILQDEQPANFLSAVFDACQDTFRDREQEFLQRTLACIVLKCYFRLQEDLDASGLASLISKLLNRGLDIHHHWSAASQTTYKWTSFFSLVSLAYADMDEFLDHAELWIQILNCTSIDVSKYLTKEFQMISESCDTGSLAPENWHNLSTRQKLEEFYYIRRPQERYRGDRITVDDWNRAMPGFRQIIDNRPLFMRGAEQSHLDWKHQRLNEEIRPEWPFVKGTSAYGSYSRGFGNLPVKSMKALASHDYFLRLIENRFERCQARKWKKLKKRENILEESRAMPGGWEMEWWEYKRGW